MAAKSAKGDGGAEQVQSKLDKWNEQGFRGGAPIDPTPNANYTVAGVTSGAPTPETDIDAEAEAAGQVFPGPLAAAAAEAEALEESGKSRPDAD